MQCDRVVDWTDTVDWADTVDWRKMDKTEEASHRTSPHGLCEGGDHHEKMSFSSNKTHPNIKLLL
jgi:hypothetical protein